MKKIITSRRMIQLGVAAALFAAVQYLHISLLYVLVGGSALGVILGKVFCRWICPLGFIMETMMSAGPDDKARSLYNYHKLGCPIAWAQGLLNRVSLLTVKREVSLCTNCGACDKTCYVTSFDKNYSLYKEEKKNPAASFTCSRCLECVGSCPTGSLSFGTRIGKKKAA